MSSIAAVLWFSLGVQFLVFGQMPNLCLDCTNSLNGRRYEFCPRDERVDLAMVMPLPCNGTCFSRSSRDDPTVMVRGCSTTVGNLPVPLPEDGCYDYDGTTVCICTRPVCNIAALGESSGVALDAHLANLTGPVVYPEDEPGVLYCHQCSNYDQQGNFYPQCPREARVNPHMVYTANCTGACFTHTRGGDSQGVLRGCTSSQYNLPYPLPADGCYNWDKDVWCICSTSRCNRDAMGASSGVDLDHHLADMHGPVVEADGIFKCFECSNYDREGKYYPQCPKNSRVRNAYLGSCNGTCFTRSYHNNASMVTRGCTDTQYGLPYPLPSDGCYTWLGDVWCVCSDSRCNSAAIGVSSGVEMDQHLVTSDEPIEEADGIFKCFQCTNYDREGRYYPQCPKNSRVRNAYLGSCNGTCFTRSYDYNTSMVARGCTSSQYGLPEPLPPDGCYTWYSEVWCVCSTSRCNGKALGKAQNIEFDAHIRKDDGAASLARNTNTLMVALSLLFAVRLRMSGHQ